METFEQLKSLLGEQFAMIFGKYIADSKAYIEQLVREIADGSKREEIAKIAHPLKSSSKQIGAETVAGLAEKIENAAWKNENIDYSALVQKLSPALKAVEEFIANHKKA